MHVCSPLIPTNSYSSHSPNSYHFHHLQLHSSSNPPNPLFLLLFPLILPLKHHLTFVPNLPIFTNHSPFASPSIPNHSVTTHTTHTTTTHPHSLHGHHPLPKKKPYPPLSTYLQHQNPHCRLIPCHNAHTITTCSSWNYSGERLATGSVGMTLAIFDPIDPTSSSFTQPLQWKLCKSFW